LGERLVCNQEVGATWPGGGQKIFEEFPPQIVKMLDVRR